MVFLEVAAVVGPVVGIALGAALNGAAESRRFRRDYVLEHAKERRDFLGEVMATVDAQHRLVHRVAGSQRGENRPVEPQGRRDADEQWGDLLRRRYLLSGITLQQSLSAYDRAREDAVQALKTKKPDPISAALAALDEARYHIFETAEDEARQLVVALGRVS
ncbi:hypothetical protein [Georgenia daeguensis]|uniref:Uncharacterized protein n=1 Tax=Georgenia daeguensis TaxID=908355 RepID=A0ABP6USK4_9MICO